MSALPPASFPRAARVHINAPTSASNRAYDALVRRIATCEHVPGAPFAEREEAARLGMSRTPFRDALNRLALEGLVSRVPKRGTFVSLLDPLDISNNMAVREAIEVEMARHVIEAGTLDGVGIEALMERQRHAIATADHRAFLAADEDFHMALVAASGNLRAVEAAGRAWLHVNRARYLVPMTRAAMRRAMRDHADIAAAIRDGSRERAQASIRDHLGEPLHRLLSEHAQRFPASFTDAALLELSQQGPRHASRPKGSARPHHNGREQSAQGRSRRAGPGRLS